VNIEKYQITETERK